MDMIIEILNIFVVPVIALGIYMKRNKLTFEDKREVFSEQALYTVLVFILSFLLIRVMNRLFGFDAAPDSQKYTMVATPIALILPYVFEIARKFVGISCDISRKDGK